MKRLIRLCLFPLFAVIIIACTPTVPERIEGMIYPGDEVDGMVFTTTQEIDWDLSLVFLCDHESVEETDPAPTIACFTTPGGSVFFGNFGGVPFNTPEEADEPWAEIKSEVTFNGQPLNLPAFGYLEGDLYDNAEWKYVRMWNLVVENIKPGTHTIQTMWGDLEDSKTFTWVFTVADEAKTYPTLSSDSPHRINSFTSEKANLNYLLYIPGEYGVNPERRWPLLIYLHGMTRVNTSLEVLINDYPLNTLKEQDYFPFIVLAPLGTGEYEFWATDEMVDSIMTLLDEIQVALTVDANRIYLTGVSAGGNGTWEIGLRHPERFAAMVSSMGYFGWPPTVPENICDLVDVPVRAFHGAKDELIPLEAEQSLVEALEACGGDVQFTVYPDLGHEVASEEVYTSELYTWLLDHALK